MHLSTKEAVAWFREKYPDAMAFKDRDLAEVENTYYYDCKESFRLSRDNWKMRITKDGGIYFSSYELNPELTIQVRWIVGEARRNERQWVRERLEEVAAELEQDHGLSEDKRDTIALALRRVRQALQIPVVKNVVRISKKKGKKR